MCKRGSKELPLFFFVCVDDPLNVEYSSVSCNKRLLGLKYKCKSRWLPIEGTVKMKLQQTVCGMPDWILDVSVPAVIQAMRRMIPEQI